MADPSLGFPAGGRIRTRVDFLGRQSRRRSPLATRPGLDALRRSASMIKAGANAIGRGAAMSSRTASCCCGQLRIEVRGEPLGVGVCHCLACQRRTGSVFAALAAFAAPYKVFGSATEYVRVGDHGARFRFRFCPLRHDRVPHRGRSRAIFRGRRRRRLCRSELSATSRFGLRLPPTFLGAIAARDQDVRPGPDLTAFPERREIPDTEAKPEIDIGSHKARRRDQSPAAIKVAGQNWK
jgi:hypothetical protein